jgi:ubiquinone/menaquinone biosynthesis C-methylase UbiE
LILNSSAQAAAVTASGVNSHYFRDGQYDGNTYHDQRQSRCGAKQFDAFLKASKHLQLPPDQMTGLCLGAGTGAPPLSICKALKERGNTSFPSFNLLDYSIGQLKVAEEALGEYDAVASSQQWNLVDDKELPFEDESIDFAECTHVLHHLTHGDPHARNLRKVFDKTRRVMKPRGRFVVVTMSPEVCRLTRWFTLLGQIATMDQSMDPGYSYGAECPKADVVLAHLADAGFEVKKVEPIRTPLVVESLYYDPAEMIKRVRNGDYAASSFFSHAADRGLLDDWLSQADQMVENGEIKTVIERADSWRELIGQATIFVAKVV